MGAQEWLLTAGVIVVPLLIAIVVTLWSLKQVRYTRKKPPPKPVAPVESVPQNGARPGNDDAAG